MEKGACEGSFESQSVAFDAFDSQFADRSIAAVLLFDLSGGLPFGVGEVQAPPGQFGKAVSPGVSRRLVRVEVGISEAGRGAFPSDRLWGQPQRDAGLVGDGVV